LFLLSRFPQRHEVIVLSVTVFPHFKNERVQPFSHPANSPVLLWDIRALVKVVGMLKYLLRSSNPIPRLGFDLNRLLFRPSKAKRMVV